ncbi:hypothetical protein LP7551_03941 [Roseibium album]|nr:hypothetical protein LP7551_03941 [Roseibium album]
MIRSFDEAEKYLVVVPFISECDRIISGTQEEYREGFFVQPEVSRDFPTKGQHLEFLLTTNQNIVTTHELYLSIVVSAQRGDLRDRHLIIDEVLSVVDVKPGPKQDVWKDFFVDKGYAQVCEYTGKITPSHLWEDDYEAVDFKDLYRQASTGCLNSPEFSRHPRFSFSAAVRTRRVTASRF